MADYDSRLPVRTEQNGDVVSKICDSTVTSQVLKVNADGSLNITDNSGSLTVDGAVTVSSTDLDIRDLTHTQDSVKVGDGTDFIAVNTDGSLNITDNGGSLTVDGSVSITGPVTVSASDFDIRDLSHTQDSVKVGDGTDFIAVNTDGSLNITDNGGSITVDGSVTVSATNLDIRDLSHTQDSVKVGDGTDFVAVNTDGSLNITDNGGSITVDGSVTVTASDLDIRDLSHTQDSIKIGDGTDFLAINTDGSINVVVDDTPGTQVNVYNTATVAGGASNTHTYTSTGNFYLTQIEASGSGKMKIEVQVNGTTIFVQFNSTATPNMTIALREPPLVTTGQTVTVIRTNRENQSQDVYSTISGHII